MSHIGLSSISRWLSLISCLLIAGNTFSQSPGVPYPYVEWEGEIQWLTGYDWGGDAFHGSLDLGDNFYYDTDMSNASYTPVELRFAEDETTYCQVYRRETGFRAAGVGIFRGSAWDISDPDNPRRLNLCFFEDEFTNDSTQANYLWDPDTTDNGGYEQLFIMASDYDGTGETYGDENYAPSSDAMFVWWPRRTPGHSFFEVPDSKLRIHLAWYAFKPFSVTPADGRLNLSWQYKGTGVDSVYLFYSQTEEADQLLTSLPIGQTSFTHTGLQNGAKYFYQLRAYDDQGDLKYVSEEKLGVPQIIRQNMSLLGQWDNRNEYGDIWGYTDPTTGKEYALLCAREAGLSIIDISGSEPVEVGFEPSTNRGVDSKDVKVYQDYAILVNERMPAQVIDISDPTDPVTISTIRIENTNEGGAHNCFVEGQYLYVVGGHDVGGLEIYDLADPSAPRLVGNFHPYYYHDVYVRNDTAYAAAIQGEGVDIIDVSDKANPKRLAKFNYAGSGAHNVWTTTDGKYAFVGDEVGSAGNWTRVFDISNLNDIQQVSDIIVDSTAVVHNCYIRGDLLYVAHYTEGVRIWDVSDPTHPEEVGFYDTFYEQNALFGGCWSVYPYFNSGKIIVSDMQSGLFVLNYNASETGTETTQPGIPQTTSFLPNYPNPFNPVTTLEYVVAEPGPVLVTIYNLAGSRITTIVNERQKAGRYTVRWNAAQVPSGVYFATLRTKSKTLSRKLILMK
ncbi:MAG: choice-of-anchor B family protein [Candidatus Marinimicrobia bacterium]|nr:choice-of-anchor B family protein [Candidatus Neomarinimicrobiota bacterium]MCF7829158.1 choice-of-anchor B family protein [Candidatus Neomarinimicrobiota bacterium]MCF7881189.1 choice-of-anchor B family protein [Candidatus Neomarinimicrobiota bacterium]